MVVDGATNDNDPDDKEVAANVDGKGKRDSFFGERHGHESLVYIMLCSWFNDSSFLHQLSGKL